MCRPRAVAGPLSGTGPARHRRPQTCRGACATDPCPSSRGDRSVDEGKSRVSAHRGPRQPRRRPNATDTTNTGQRRGRFASAEFIQRTRGASVACIHAGPAPCAQARSGPVRARMRSPQRSAGAAAVEALDGPRHADSPKPRAVAAAGGAGACLAGVATRLRAPVTCWPGAGEWPAHGARSTHRKPARGDPPFRRGSDARGTCETGPGSSCR